MKRIGLGLAATLLCVVSAHAQDTSLLTKAVSISGDCRIPKNALAILTDGNPKTALENYRQNACEVIFRFDVPVAASRAIISTIFPGEGKQNKTSFASVWGSHQGFGDVFFKLGESKFPSDSLADVAFEEPVKLRSLKILIEASGKGGWPRGSSGHDVRINDIALLGKEDSSGVSRWPQKPMQPLKGKADPFADGAATQCDEFAGFPFNPDSYGYSRSDRDIDVPKAIAACEIAVAEQPQSARLAFNLARAELLGERTSKAIARLTSPLIADYAPAQYLLAKSFEDGIGVQKSEEKAKALYEASAKQDFGPALHWLAMKAHETLTKEIASGKTDTGDGAVEANLQRAIDLGHMPSISRYFEHGLKYSKLSVKDAYALLEQAAESGDIGPLGDYSANLSNGYKISSRSADGDRYQLRLAQLNDYISMTNYALDAFSSNGWYWKRRAAYSGLYWPLERYAKDLQDKEKRTFFAKMAFDQALEDAETGAPWSMEWVAQYYGSGFGTEKDKEQERLWRCRAQAAGNPLALSKSVSGGCSNE